ncbi:hypothetical protein BIU98_07595 [Curtobacterium sp. MMLR14_010]|jgi:hypothetical protein|uniref:DUF3566 domain-containing protein n=1 Tax=Curtobacterium sp. MMLR14_010 TaxID=1898743 RepID=UPI0008DE0033|nr:DUF3566 domain-containing protein [Curtobacterium sp. MMLR14_010]OII31627.1 hypothetical protein BIU98_07595 [Curtobacterium sp. MMLR14_010]
MSSVAEKLQRKAKRPVGTRQVRLRLVYLDFWSVVKLSFLIALAGSIVIVVATALVWLILNQTGVFEKVDMLLKDVTGQNSYSIMDQFSLGQVLGFSIVVGILNVVVGTVLGAIVSVLYNLSVRITGGLLVGFTNN